MSASGSKQVNHDVCTNINRNASPSTVSIESSCGWSVWCVVLSPGSHLSCALPQVVLEPVASLERNAFLGVGK